MIVDTPVILHTAEYNARLPVNLPGKMGEILYGKLTITMSDMENLQLFEDQAIRTAWNEEEEEWYFSVVDVVWALTDQPDIRRAAKYWSVLKNRIKKEKGELTTICSQLKLKAADGKRRLTDVANTEQLLRIIQSIPLQLNHVVTQMIEASVIAADDDEE